MKERSMAKKPPVAPIKRRAVMAHDGPKRPKPSASPEATSAHLIKQVLSASHGILRLAPTWVPRSFLMPGRRLKLRPNDLYALGTKRGGIDERWFSSTTVAANEGAPWDEGLSYVVHDGKKAFTLREAIALAGADLIGPPIWERYQRWPVYSKFFDNLGPIPASHAPEQRPGGLGRAAR
jgi:hypothetical protein